PDEEGCDSERRALPTLKADEGPEKGGACQQREARVANFRRVVETERRQEHEESAGDQATSAQAQPRGHPSNELERKQLAQDHEYLCRYERGLQGERDRKKPGHE